MSAVAKGGVNEKWTSKNSGDSVKKVREAFHIARKEAREEGGRWWGWWSGSSGGGSNGPPPKDGCYTDNYGSD